jgi:capsular polysaccharide biosynthesis protein
LVSFVGALFLAAGSVFVADYLDPSIRTPSEVTALLNVPVLVSLPKRDRRVTAIAE